MSEEKVKTLRILELDDIIRKGNYPNATDLGKQFEVSRSTIMRDLDFLRDRYKAPLEFDQSKNGYYYSDPTFFIKNVMLTEGELFATSAVIPLLNQYKNTPLEKSIINILKKITSLMPSQVSVNPSFIGNNISLISDPLPIIDKDVFYAVFKSLKLKTSLDFDYISLQNQKYTPHTADPYHVICQNGNWYMLSYCHEHKDIRMFSLSRIKSPKCSKKSFTVQKDFNPQKYFDSSFGVWSTTKKPVKIELLFSKDISTFVLERTWHETQTIKQKQDGTVLLTFKTNQIQETLFRILRFGSSVKVLSPESLVKLVKSEIKKMKNIYNL